MWVGLGIDFRRTPGVVSMRAVRDAHVDCLDGRLARDADDEAGGIHSCVDAHES
jgi:hypothetical protein